MWVIEINILNYNHNLNGTMCQLCFLGVGWGVMSVEEWLGMAPFSE